MKVKELTKSVTQQARGQVIIINLSETEVPSDVYWNDDVRMIVIKEILGGNDEAIRLYQLFKDPQSSPKQKEYSFMTVGPVSPLSFSGIPLFFTALHYPDDFVKSNTFGVREVPANPPSTVPSDVAHS